MVHLTFEELEHLSDLKTRFLEKTDSQMSELHSLLSQQLRLKAKLTDERAEIFQIQHKIDALQAYLANSRLTFEFEIFDALSAPAKESMQKNWLFAAAFGASSVTTNPSYHAFPSSEFSRPLQQPPPIDVQCPNCTFSKNEIADACVISRELPIGLRV